MLQNLIDNAVKFMGDQPRPRIDVGTRREGDETVCYVRDNGVGIEARYLEKVFELFDRLDTFIPDVRRSDHTHLRFLQAACNFYTPISPRRASRRRLPAG